MDEVAPGVFVATAKQYTTTTTVIVGADEGCLIVDPAVSVADLDALARWLAARGLRPAAGWSTHPHWDHLLWSAALGDAPRYATPRAVATAAREQAGLLSGVADGSPGHDLARFAQVEPVLDTRLDWDGPVVRVLEHDGHAPGHGALFLPATGVLIAGDMCSDIEIPLLDADTADPLGDYRHGLGLLAHTPGVTVLIPGHGQVTGHDGFRRRIAADFRYLDALETGADPADPWLTLDPRPSADWLRAEHARQLAVARGAAHGEPER